MFKLIKKGSGTIRNLDGDNQSVENLLTKDDTESLSVAIKDVVDYDLPQEAKYNRFYYVLSGSAEYTFDEEEIMLEEGDSLFIEMGAIYHLKGTFRLLVINQPAYGM